MQITKELLDEQIKHIEKQISGYQGALDLAIMLRNAMDQPEETAGTVDGKMDEPVPSENGVDPKKG